VSAGQVQVQVQVQVRQAVVCSTCIRYGTVRHVQCVLTFVAVSCCSAMRESKEVL
jgi:hypothetical protein